MPAWLPFAFAGASALANVIRGGVQAGQARKLENKFESLDKALQPVSPEQYAYLNRVRQMQRSMAMGTDPTSAMARRGLSQGLAQTQGNIARVGGGPSTVSGLLRAQQGYSQGMSQIAGNAFQASQGLMQQEQGLLGDIQNAVYGLQMKRRNLAQAQAAQMRQASTDSTMAAIAGLGQMATLFPGKEKDLDVPGTTAAAKTATQQPSLKIATPSVPAQTIPRVQQSIASDVGPKTGVVGPTAGALSSVLNNRTFGMVVNDWTSPDERIEFGLPERFEFKPTQ